MRIVLPIILLLAFLPNMVYAGQATIRENDSQIVVEYEGDANEAALAKIVKERDEELKTQEERENAIELEKKRISSENRLKLLEQRRAKDKAGNED